MRAAALARSIALERGKVGFLRCVARLAFLEDRTSTTSHGAPRREHASLAPLTSARRDLSNRLPYDPSPGRHEQWMRGGRPGVTTDMMMQGSRSAARTALMGRSLYIVRDAIDLVGRHLATQPWSPGRAQLEVWLQECRSAVDGWDTAPPTAEERDGVMKRVLQLHTALSRVTEAG